MFDSFDRLPLSPKARSIAVHCHENAKCNLALSSNSTFLDHIMRSENAEQNWAFLSKTQSYINRFGQKPEWNCEFLAVYNIFREEAELYVLF